MNTIKVRITAAVMKRIIYVCLVIIFLINFSSCSQEPHEFHESTSPDIYLLQPPNYTKNYTYLPIIEYKGREFRLDQMNVRKRGYEVSELTKSFDEIEQEIRSMDNAMIVIATVMENPKQLTEASATSISFNAEVICPVRIDSMLYKSDDNLSEVGDIIEVDLSGEMCIIEGWMEYMTDGGNDPSGEFVADECELYLSHAGGLAMISGAQYMLYLYDTEQPEYNDYRRYDVISDYRFEITNYGNSFEYLWDARLLFQNDLWSEPFRLYNIIKEGGFVYDPSVYPASPSLESENDVKTVGIKIGDTIVEGYEQLDRGYKCIGYSEKDGEYSYEYFNYETYDLSSGKIPEGCPTVVCEYNETIDVIVEGEPAVWFNQGGRVLSVELYDIHGESYASYNPDHKQVYRSGHQVEAGVYFLKIELMFFGPDMPLVDRLWDDIPEVGKEYIAEKSYLFAIVMD